MTNYRLLNKYITEEIDPNAVYVLSLSYGKDSLACLGAIEKLGLPLHRIVHAEVWATDTIPAELPPMMEFKARADEIIERRWGIKVEHICATKKVCGGGQQKLSYEQMFYNVLESGQFAGAIKGFPLTIGSWCKKLKYENGAVDVRRYILSSCAIAGGGQGFTVSRCSAGNGATRLSKCKPSDRLNHGFCDEMESILHGGTQTNRITGFPISVNRGNWCTQLKQRVFQKPEHDGRYKCRAVSWDCGGRAFKN